MGGAMLYRCMNVHGAGCIRLEASKPLCLPAAAIEKRTRHGQDSDQSLERFLCPGRASSRPRSTIHQKASPFVAQSSTIGRTAWTAPQKRLIKCLREEPTQPLARWQFSSAEPGTAIVIGVEGRTPFRRPSRRSTKLSTEPNRHRSKVRNVRVAPVAPSRAADM